jgi:hypothetical protein
MGVQEIELAIQRLSGEQLAELSTWFEEYLAQDVDRRLETAIESGFFDEMARQAQEDSKSGRCTPL